MIEARGLTKRFGDKVAVDDLSFTVQPGIVTGFLGPNGAGKSTTMRMILGLDRPTAGEAVVNGHRYGTVTAPMREVGACSTRGTCTADVRRVRTCVPLAFSNGLPGRRVDEVLEMTGMTSVGRQAHQGLLAGHVAAARDRRRAPGRPGRADVRRARQRPRPRGHPLDPQLHAVPRVDRPHGRSSPAT